MGGFNLNGVILGYNISLEEQMHPLTLKLKKYEGKVKDEPVQVDKNAMRYWRFSQKRRCADVIMSDLKMRETQKTRVQFLIKEFPNTQKLCARCSFEVVITALCMYIKFSDYKKRPLNEYSICKKMGLTEEIYSTIITKVANHFQQLQPVRHGCYV